VGGPVDAVGGERIEGPQLLERRLERSRTRLHLLLEQVALEPVLELEATPVEGVRDTSCGSAPS
jgi:hypothetical protein